MSSTHEVKKDAVFQQAQEIFSGMEPEVIYMVLSEYNFNLDQAMESLIMLSQGSEESHGGHTNVTQPQKSNFQNLFDPETFNAHQYGQFYGQSVTGGPQGGLTQMNQTLATGAPWSLTDFDAFSAYSTNSSEAPDHAVHERFQTNEVALGPPSAFYDNDTDHRKDMLDDDDTSEGTVEDTETVDIDNAFTSFDNLAMDALTEIGKAMKETANDEAQTFRRHSDDPQRCCENTSQSNPEINKNSNAMLDSDVKKFKVKPKELNVITGDDNVKENEEQNMLEIDQGIPTKVTNCHSEEVSVESIVGDDLHQQHLAKHKSDDVQDTVTTTKRCARQQAMLINSVFSYTGIGGLNGVRIAFSGSSQTPTSVSGLFPSQDPRTLFNKKLRKLGTAKRYRYVAVNTDLEIDIPDSQVKSVDTKSCASSTSSPNLSTSASNPVSDPNLMDTSSDTHAIPIPEPKSTVLAFEHTSALSVPSHTNAVVSSAPSLERVDVETLETTTTSHNHTKVHECSAAKLFTAVEQNIASDEHNGRKRVKVVPESSIDEHSALRCNVKLAGNGTDNASSNEIPVVEQSENSTENSHARVKDDPIMDCRTQPHEPDKRKRSGTEHAGGTPHGTSWRPMAHGFVPNASIPVAPPGFQLAPHPYPARFGNPPPVRRINDPYAAAVQLRGAFYPDMNVPLHGGYMYPVPGPFMQNPYYTNQQPGYYPTMQNHRYGAPFYCGPRMPDQQRKQPWRPATIEKSMEHVTKLSSPHGNIDPERPQITSPPVKATVVKKDTPGNCVASIPVKPDPHKFMYILRGLPGSGKTALAKKLVGKKGRILSTDDYFITGRGQYVYDVTRLGEAHEHNQKLAKKCVLDGVSPIIIDNTNICAWEMKPYAELAIRNGYQIRIREPNTAWKFKPGQCARRNSHGVTIYTIRKMLERYEYEVTVEKLLKASKPMTSAHHTARDNSHTEDSRNTQNNSHTRNVQANGNVRLTRVTRITEHAGEIRTNYASHAAQNRRMTSTVSLPGKNSGFQNGSAQPANLLNKTAVAAVSPGAFQSPFSKTDGPLSASTPLSGVQSPVQSSSRKPPVTNSNNMSGVLSQEKMKRKTKLHASLIEPVDTSGTNANLRQGGGKVKDLVAVRGCVDRGGQHAADGRLTGAPVVSVYSDRSDGSIDFGVSNMHKCTSATKVPIRTSVPLDTRASDVSRPRSINSSLALGNSPFHKDVEILSSTPDRRSKSLSPRLSSRKDFRTPNLPELRFPYNRSGASVTKTVQQQYVEEHTQGNRDTEVVMEQQHASLEAVMSKNHNDIPAPSLGASVDQRQSSDDCPVDSNGESLMDETSDQKSSCNIEEAAPMMSANKQSGDITENSQDYGSAVKLLDTESKASHSDMFVTGTVHVKKQKPGRSKLAAVFRGRPLLSNDLKQKLTREKKWGEFDNIGVAHSFSEIDSSINKICQIIEKNSDDGAGSAEQSVAQPNVRVKNKTVEFGTNTDAEDFTRARKAEFESNSDYMVMTGIVGRFIPGAQDSFGVEQRVPTTITFDKSVTAGGGLERTKRSNNISHDLDTLKLLFDDLPADKLHEIYQDCDQNLEWTSNILAESSMFGEVSLGSKSFGTISEVDQSPLDVGPQTGVKNLTLEKDQTPKNKLWERERKSESPASCVEDKLILEAVGFTAASSQISETTLAETERGHPTSHSGTGHSPVAEFDIGGTAASDQLPHEIRLTQNIESRHDTEESCASGYGPSPRSIQSPSIPSDSIDFPQFSSRGESYGEDKVRTLGLSLPKEFIHAMAREFGGLPARCGVSGGLGVHFKGPEYGKCMVQLEMSLVKEIHKIWVQTMVRKRNMQTAMAEFRKSQAQQDERMRTWELEEVQRLQKQYEDDEQMARRLQLAEDRGESEYQKPTLDNDENNRNIKKRHPNKRTNTLRKAEAPLDISPASSTASSTAHLGASPSAWQSAGKLMLPESKSMIEIMDEEAAAEDSERKQREERWEKEDDLSTRMKRKELHEMYPGLPSDLLDDIFSANSKNLESSVFAVNCFWLDEMHPPASVMSERAREVYDRQILESTKLRSAAELNPAELTEPIISRMACPPVVGSAEGHRGAESSQTVPSYESLRAEAQIHRKQMEEAFKKAATAFQQKKRAISTYYAHQGHIHRTEFKEANRRAAELIYQRRNLGRHDRNEIDLHGLHVSEALSTLAQKLAEMKGVKQCINVITGKGTNSYDGVPRVKNAVTEWLSANNMKFSELEGNAGILKVEL